MKNLINLLLMSVLALLVGPSHQLDQHRLFSEYLVKRRSAVDRQPQEWTPPSITTEYANVTSLPYPWEECSGVLSYNSYATTMFPIYQRMMKAGLRILVYSGDVDARVPVTSTRYSINALNLSIEKAWYPWIDGDIDVGDYSVIYKGLIFATVRGAGHQVPSYQPSRALTMTKSFLARKPLP